MDGSTGMRDGFRGSTTRPALMGQDTEDVDWLFSDAWQENEREQHS